MVHQQSHSSSPNASLKSGAISLTFPVAIPTNLQSELDHWHTAVS